MSRKKHIRVRGAKAVYDVEDEVQAMLVVSLVENMKGVIPEAWNALRKEWPKYSASEIKRLAKSVLMENVVTPLIDNSEDPLKKKYLAGAAGIAMDICFNAMIEKERKGAN